MLYLPDLEISWVLLCFVFIIAGLVKGVVGTGLPVVALVFLTVSLDLKSAISIFLAPAIATNIVQVCIGGHLKDIILRLKGFYFAATLSVGLGLSLQIYVPDFALFLLLGGLLIIYASVGWLTPQWYLCTASERRYAPLAGIINGTVTGLVGILYFPGIMFLQSLNMNRHALVQAMGLLFLLSSLALSIGFMSHGYADVSHLITSLICVIPAVLGWWLGAVIRHHMSATMFRQALLLVLFVSGIYICIRGLNMGAF